MSLYMRNILIFGPLLTVMMSPIKVHSYGKILHQLIMTQFIKHLYIELNCRIHLFDEHIVPRFRNTEFSRFIDKLIHCRTSSVILRYFNSKQNHLARIFSSFIQSVSSNHYLKLSFLIQMMLFCLLLQINPQT